MPSASNVGRRYAGGIFQLAQEEKAIDTWRQEVARLDDLLSDDVLQAAFQNPAVGLDRRMDLAARLAPELRPETRNLMRLLIEHHRTPDMPAIRREFDRLADEASGMVSATMTTAIPLEESERRRYEQQLSKKLDRKVRLALRTDPALIGGASIQIGDHLVDASVKTRLDRLREDLLR
ncbi:MAG TPA: F0F1 ATP synthase subunit delta [Candidatus Dormibacteraeota bacterium]|nr:F0F1 ATP synthase subunit delta [Candidatus Dormibacteraeota bacterium]